MTIIDMKNIKELAIKVRREIVENALDPVGISEITSFSFGEVHLGRNYGLKDASSGKINYEFDALIEKEGTKYYIYFSNITSQFEWENYTYAHVLGHICLGHFNKNDIGRFRDEIAFYTDVFYKEEEAANFFARNFVIADDALRHSMRYLDYLIEREFINDMETYNKYFEREIYKLSKVYNVPVPVVKKRIEDYNNEIQGDSNE